MPWPTYPMTLRTSSSQEEGADRQWAIATKEFIGDGNGKLKALKIVDLEWKITEDGKPAQFVEGREVKERFLVNWPCLQWDLSNPQQEGLIEQLGVELDERGNVKASEKNYKTSINKIFTAGDMRRGQTLVVWAISEGRECARED